MSASKTPSVPAVERALLLLESLAESKNGLSLAQLVERSGLPKSSLHCLLLTLERANYLHRSPQTGRYMFGLKLFGLANTSLSGLRIREQAAPFLVDLMERTRLTVHMGVLEQNEAVVIAKYDPPSSTVATWRGQRMGIHCSGLGKVLAAYLPFEELQSLYNVRRFSRHNENTITSLRKFEDDLKRIRVRMYAVDDEESEIGWRCIGAPIFNETGSTVAAVSVAGTVHQIHSDNLTRIAETVRHCALEISYFLGYLKEANAYKRA
jgi:DNA-binding IclR family transcriptional regulator